MSLRSYQADIVEQTRASFKAGHRAVLVVLPTGGGKTHLGAHIINGAAQKGNLSWWVNHRKELSAQASKTFYGFGIPHGQIRSGYPISDDHAVHIAMVQTLARRMDKLKEPNLIIIDEAHHLGAKTWQAIIDRYPKARIIGLTATPWRLDGRGLGRWFDVMVKGPEITELIELGALSRYKLYGADPLDLAGVKSQAGDYQSKALSEIMDKPSITGDAIQHYNDLCRGKRAIGFAVNIEHSKSIVAQFLAAGIPAAHVDGETPDNIRDQAITDFQSGKILALWNVGLFGEGFDVPAIEAVIDLAPTKSLSLVKQRWGRAMRPEPGKDHAILLDHAGNHIRHSILPDTVIDWTLDDREKKKRASTTEIAIRQCKQCYFVYKPAPKCPQCGHSEPVAVREIETIDGTLKEISHEQLQIMREQKQKRQQQGRADSLEALMKIEQERGYKSGWARHVWASRQRKRA